MEQEMDYDGITEQDINDLIQRASTAETRNAELSQAMTSLSSEKSDDNFLHHQISTQELLEKHEHFYRGDFQGRDEEGNLVWKKQKNKDLVTFNEFGVTSMMDIIARYIDKNTILSNYTEARINQIIAAIGKELILFILCNYDQIGMNTYFKKTKFRLVITTTCHTIESAYRRALDGQTMEELNQSKVVGQFGNRTGEALPIERKLNPIQKFFGFK